MKKNKLLIWIGLPLLTGLFAPLPATAQFGRAAGYQNLQHHDERPYHFGFMLGANRLNYSLREAANQPDFEHVLPIGDYGFQLGVVANLKLTDFFDLRFLPSVLFNGASFSYARRIEYLEPDDNRIQSVFEASYMEFPFHLKYKSARMTNTRVYLTGGPKYTYALNTPDMVDRTRPDDIYTHLTRHDFYLEAGTGFEYYFYYFKFAMEIKASFGIRNLLQGPGDRGDHFHDSLEQLRSKAILVSFYFE